MVGEVMMEDADRYNDVKSIYLDIVSAADRNTQTKVY